MKGKVECAYDHIIIASDMGHGNLFLFGIHSILLSTKYTIQMRTKTQLIIELKWIACKPIAIPYIIVLQINKHGVYKNGFLKCTRAKQCGRRQTRKNSKLSLSFELTITTPFLSLFNNRILMKFLFFCLFSEPSTSSSKRFLTDFLQEYPTPGTGPYFDTSLPPNVTGLVGKTVHLICKVKNLGNRTVSCISLGFFI